MAHAPYFQFNYTALAVCKVLLGYGTVGVAVAVPVAVDVNVCVGANVAVGVDVGVAVKVDVGGTTVVGGRDVNVAVGGWELCRVMRGLIHSA